MPVFVFYFQTKAQTNGHVVAVPVPEESASKPNSPKASKQASTPKATRSEPKSAAKPDVKKDKVREHA